MAICSLYTNIDNFPTKSLKRKWEDDTEQRSSPDQIVPQFSAEKKQKTEFPFSNLMRSMAAKYQPQTPSVTAPAAYNPLLMSLFAPINNPYSRLMAAMADLSQPKSPQLSPKSPQSSPKTPSEVITVSSLPLDLSKPIEKEIDVVSNDEEEDITEDIEQWSPAQVNDFIRNIDGCEDFGLIFESEKITGLKLKSMNVHQLVQILGLPLGQSIRIVAAVRNILA